jgi:hypothetical protein
VTSNYIIFVATKVEVVYICARSTQYWIISTSDSDDIVYKILCEHNPVWIKNLCVTQNCMITELNRQQVKGHLAVFLQKYQSIVHWNCSCCFAKITAALLINRLITVTWCFCYGTWSSLLIDGILIVVWTWYKCIKC